MSKPCLLFPIPLKAVPQQLPDKMRNSALLEHKPKGITKYFQVFLGPKAEDHLLYAGFLVFKKVGAGLEHDLGASIFGKAEDAGAYRWKGNAFEIVFRRPLEAVQSCLMQLIVLIALPITRPDSMDHMTGSKIACPGDDCPTNGCPPDAVALFLNTWPPFGANSPCDAASQDELRIGGIHYGIHLELRQIALYELDSLSVDVLFHDPSPVLHTLSIGCASFAELILYSFMHIESMVEQHCKSR